jgi:curved DNA-binding protein
MIDPYKVLGLDRSATIDDIKKMYRKLAKEFHPDKSGGDDTRFKEIANAYSILSDPTKKDKLDRSTSTYTQFDEQFFEEFLKHQNFSNMFDNKYGWSQNGKGSNVNAEIQITLEEAYFGIKKELRLGLKSIAVSIKPGIVNGQRLRLKGLGQKGLTEDLNGDVILTVNIQGHHDYMLDNRGLHKIHKVDVFDAMLGCRTSIEIFDKKIYFNISPGTQNGAVLRIQGKGFPVYEKEDKHGDLYVNVLLKTPDDLTPEELISIEKIKNMINERRTLA